MVSSLTLPATQKTTRLLTWLLTFAVLGSGVATFYTVTSGDTPLGPDPQAIMRLILGNLLFFAFLLLLVVHRVLSLWRTVRNSAGSAKLQKRILLMFSGLTILPALVVSLFAVLLFHLGIQSWFNQRVSIALEESVMVAQSYLTEHKSILRADALGLSSDLDQHLLHVVGSNTSLLTKALNRQAELRSLTEGMIIQNNQIVAQTSLSFALAFERIEDDKRMLAAQGEPVIWVEGEDRIRALIKLSALPDAYLVVGRLVDDRVLNHMDNATGAVAEYRRMREKVSLLQLQFSTVFGLLVLLLLLLSIWYGMQFASRLVVPVARLIRAAERVRDGDYEVKVPIGAREDEIATLIRSFNRMTGELERKHGQLEDANRQVDGSRRFSETVLAGISAGVIAVDKHKNITLHNGAAAEILYRDRGTDMSLKNIFSVFPELKGSFSELVEKPKEILTKQLKIEREGVNHHLVMHLAAEIVDGELQGYIITFDDMTALVAAQRSAAWADVARRVAHEIKNPLTPIQLSAERLRRKYSPQITEDLASYQRYTDTIIRHVGDIGRMVEEFVGFARMPDPVFTPENLETLLNKVIFSEKTAHPSIGYTLDSTAVNTNLPADERQITRAFTNLLKNAAEAIEEVEKRATEQHQDGTTRTVRPEIHVSLSGDSSSKIIVHIEDNGPGFPPELLERIMEPYVTSKEKGSGLGLAIVNKIMEDHGAEMYLGNRTDEGAEVILTFTVDGGKNVT
ncbi:MAG: PAS domain-containing sensor histidine kinase [Rickettsiales bacterium]|nr:PAS domain-containing sensor histidine kinase [Rickettsiales bacterium]